MESLRAPAPSSEWRSIVGRVLSAWGGYQLGVEQRAGGEETNEKHVWFGDVLADHIANGRGLTADGLEEWIDCLLYQDFDLVLEDDSTYPTAHLLMEAHGYWKSGERARLSRLLDSLPSEERLKAARAASRRGEEQQEEDGEPLDDEEDHDAAGDRDGDDDNDDDGRPKRDRQPRTTVDDDGWTTVNKR